MTEVSTTIEITIDPRKIEVVARMMTYAMGLDPDKKVPAPYFADARLVPTWHLHVDFARRFIAGYQTMQQIASA